MRGGCSGPAPSYGRVRCAGSGNLGERSNGGARVGPWEPQHPPRPRAQAWKASSLLKLLQRPPLKCSSTLPVRRSTPVFFWRAKGARSAVWARRGPRVAYRYNECDEGGGEAGRAGARTGQRRPPRGEKSNSATVKPLVKPTGSFQECKHASCAGVGRLGWAQRPAVPAERHQRVLRAGLVASCNLDCNRRPGALAKRAQSRRIAAAAPFQVHSIAVHCFKRAPGSRSA